MSERERAGGRVVVVLVLVLALLVGGGYAAAWFEARDRTPRGTTVAGVDVGQLNRARAAQALREGLRERAGRAITLRVEGRLPDRMQTVMPREAGLAVAWTASVSQVPTGDSWDVQRLWEHYTGGVDHDPVVTVDDARMDALLDRLDEAVGTPATEGDVSFHHRRLEVTDPQPGQLVDRGSAREAIEAAYLSEDPETQVADIALRDDDPKVDAADVQDALTGFANPAMAGPVTLAFGHRTARLAPREFAPALSMRAEHGRLVPEVDGERLAGLVPHRVRRATRPVDATVRLVHGRPRVVPGRPGVRYTRADIADAFLRAVGHDGRRAKVHGHRVAPEVTTKDARRLRIKEKVSSFTTTYPHADYRNTNIGRAAALVDGTVLEPGETFSLNDTVGERTRKNGFTEGFVINDGVLTEDLGGGVSQLATTLFNAMFFAGLEDVEHKPHSFYIDRYPVGREATVAWGSVDLRFRNDTRHGVLIDAHVTPSTPSSSGVVRVTMWSTKVWDVDSATSDRYDRVPPRTRHRSGQDCHPHDGYAGFSVDVTREFRKPGRTRLDHDETFHTDYTPADTVVCD